MAYATQADIVTLYSEDALYVADRNGDGVAESDAILRALEGASAEIDSYLGVRYALPVTQTDLLTQFAVDIALYRLALARSVLTEEHRRRYEDAIAHLKRIADGKAVLVQDQAQGGGSGTSGDDLLAGGGPRPIVSNGPERLFTRHRLEDF